jgi:hypothetical protein
VIAAARQEWQPTGMRCRTCRRPCWPFRMPATASCLVLMGFCGGTVLWLRRHADLALGSVRESDTSQCRLKLLKRVIRLSYERGIVGVSEFSRHVLQKKLPAGTV